MTVLGCHCEERSDEAISPTRMGNWEAGMAETRIGVIGCAGRVGRMLVADIVAAEGCALTGGVARKGNAPVGQDIREPAGARPIGIPRGHNPEGRLLAPAPPRSFPPP